MYRKGCLPETEPLPTSTSIHICQSLLTTPRQVDGGILAPSREGKAKALSSIFEPTENRYNFVDWAREPMVLTPPSPGCELCVIILVRDEEDNLASTLYALAHQVDLNGQPLRLLWNHLGYRFLVTELESYLDQPDLIESPEAIASRLQRRRALRQL